MCREIQCWGRKYARVRRATSLSTHAYAQYVRAAWSPFTQTVIYVILFDISDKDLTEAHNSQTGVLSNNEGILHVYD